MNTASCRSAITFIDGERGILRYRGYPIQELAERVSFLEVAWLLVSGDLPDPEELADWTDQINHHTFVKENIKKFIDGFHHDAHPMGILVSTVGALSTFYPDATQIDDPAVRRRQMVRLIARSPPWPPTPTGTPAAIPTRTPTTSCRTPATSSTSCGRWGAQVPSRPGARARPWTCCSPCTPTTSRTARPTPCGRRQLPGRPLLGRRRGHGRPVRAPARRANEQVLRCSTRSARPTTSPAYLERVKQGELKLMGFGHRVYKNYDPRARIIKQVAEDVFKVTGLNPLLEIAVELERIALEDDYFISHKLYPNVDFYSGIIYEAMGFPTEMFPVLFAIGRMPGWLAQWEENLTDPEQRIARPRQIYVGPGERHVERD
jgi:citrate synthase